MLPGMATPESESHEHTHSESFLRSLMRRQLKLSITCALSFLIALLGLPLLNYFMPEAMSGRVGGFTLSWLILGILFFPLVWGIAWVFIRRSIALEDLEVEEVNARKRQHATPRR